MTRISNAYCTTRQAPRLSLLWAFRPLIDCRYTLIEACRCPVAESEWKTLIRHSNLEILRYFCESGYLSSENEEYLLADYEATLIEEGVQCFDYLYQRCRPRLMERIKSKAEKNC